MSYTRWLFLTTGLTLLFTSGGLWLEARLKGEPAAVARPSVTETSQPALQVLITGAVARPGLYRLPAGSLLQALLDAAGGPSPDARLSSLDLNRPLRPGEVLHLPGTPAADSKAQASENKPTSRPSSHKASRQTSGPVSINRANAREFENLPGVGPALAKRIVEWRQAHGGFKSLEDLLEVKGIGPKKFDKMRAQLSL